MPAYPRGLDLIQSHNNAKRLRIAIPELFLIRIKKRILDISFEKQQYYSSVGYS